MTERMAIVPTTLAEDVSAAVGQLSGWLGDTAYKELLSASPNAGKVSREKFTKATETAIENLGRIGSPSLEDFALAVITALGLEIEE